MSLRSPPGVQGRHQPSKWDRGDVRLYGRSERVLSPAQRGEVTESGPIPPEVEWSELRAYVCNACKDHCINWLGSECAQASECRTCHLVRRALFYLPPQARKRQPVSERAPRVTISRQLGNSRKPMGRNSAGLEDHRLYSGWISSSNASTISQRINDGVSWSNDTAHRSSISPTEY